MIVEELGLGSAKPIVTPGSDELQGGYETQLPPSQAGKYRSPTARLNYLPTDRPDLQFSVKELCRSMSSPCHGDWVMLERVGKYLKMKLRLIISYTWRDPGQDLVVHSDANWAGCNSTRRSTSGGIIRLGQHLLKSYSRTRNLVALSSAENDFYAIIKPATEALGLHAMLVDVGDDAMLHLNVDASAAPGVVQRHDIGKIRHLQTSGLWIQAQIVKTAMTFHKVHGSLNPSDVQTKHVRRKLCERHMAEIGCRFAQGRTQTAVQLHSLRRSLRQLHAQAKGKRDEEARRKCVRDFKAITVDNDSLDKGEKGLDNMILKLDIGEEAGWKRVCDEFPAQVFKDETWIRKMLKGRSRVDSLLRP